MKFIIERSSNEIIGQTRKPCKEAKKEKGFWRIEIKSLKELLKLQKKYGKLILEDKEIIIYDDWIE